jgi:hypothetical protein
VPLASRPTESRAETLANNSSFDWRRSTLACADYEKLRREFESERGEWFRIVGDSEHKSKVLANEVLESVNEVRREMFHHRQFCHECNHADIAIPPKARSAQAGNTH